MSTPDRVVRPGGSYPKRTRSYNGVLIKGGDLERFGMNWSCVGEWRKGILVNSVQSESPLPLQSLREKIETHLSGR